MKQFLFTAGAVALVALASCSNEESVVNPTVANSSEISYQVVTNNSSRANSLFNAGSKPDFKVLATISGELTNGNNTTYFGFDQVNYTDGAYVPVTSRYWPSGKTLDFFAYSSNFTAAATHSGSGDAQKITFEEYTMPEDAQAQEDILYAVTRGKTKENGKVVFNFRHALSQFAFKFKNESEGLYVEVQEVKLVNINTSGVLSVSANQTGTQYTTGGTYQTATCAWNFISAKAPKAGTTTSTGIHPLSKIALDAPMALGYNEVKDFTVDAGNAAKNVMFAMPQNLNVLDLSNVTTATAKPVDQYNGMYFLIKVKLANISDIAAGYNAAKDVTLYDDGQGGLKDVLIPVTAFTEGENAWVAGKKYVYTFIFGRNGGNGGYDPDKPDPDNPVLDDIAYSVDMVTVDDWYEAGNTDVNMSTK